MYLFIKSISVYTEGIDMSKRGRYATLPEKVHQRMYSLLIVNVEVPKHILIWDICLRMTFMTSVHAGKFDGIPNEEDWQIVENKVLISILCEELHCPSTDITNSVA